MKFVISQSEFSKALLTSGKSILSRANLPILSNVLIKASAGKVEILATNLETATKVELKCKVESEGKATVNGKTLLEFTSQLPESELVFEKLGEEAIVSTKGYSGRFATIAPEEFPAIPKIEKGFVLEVGCGDFVDAASKVAFSAAQDEGRPILTSVLCDIAKNEIKMVATDGYRLGFQEINTRNSGITSNLKINVPARAINEVAKIILELGLVEVEDDKKDEKNSIKITVSQNLNQISFQLDGVEFISRLIEGEFPNWQKIIPSTFNTKVKIAKDEFIKLIKVASIFARESGSIVKLKFETGSANKSGSAPLGGGAGRVPDGDSAGPVPARHGAGILRVNAASSQVGSSDANCDVDISGSGGEIAFNYRYLLEILAVVSGEEVNFEMNESLNPGRITSLDPKNNFFHIIMPVRLQS